MSRVGATPRPAEIDAINRSLEGPLYDSSSRSRIFWSSRRSVGKASRSFSRLAASFERMMSSKERKAASHAKATPSGASGARILPRVRHVPEQIAVLDRRREEHGDQRDQHEPRPAREETTGGRTRHDGAGA
jgi:hypothetical protein